MDWRADEVLRDSVVSRKLPEGLFWILAGPISLDISYQPPAETSQPVGIEWVRVTDNRNPLHSRPALCNHGGTHGGMIRLLISLAAFLQLLQAFHRYVTVTMRIYVSKPSA